MLPFAYNIGMKFFRWLALLLAFLLTACQSSISSSITIIDGGQIYRIDSTDRIPLTLLTQAGIVPQPYDRVILNGSLLLPIDQPLPESDFTQLQLKRAFPLTVITPQGQQVIQSAAWTVGDVLREMGLTLYASDFIDPPASATITGPLTITYRPAQEMSITAGGKVIQVRSAAGTVGEVLAEAGIPLTGLDISFPSENEAPPSDGQMRVVHVRESVEVVLQPIPFQTETKSSVDVPLGEKKIIQSGINGLSMVRTRVRYEDGVEVSREVEGESVLREPVKEIVATGEQVVLNQVGGDIPYKYWRAVQMYASVYSPCQSGTGGCSYGTASGARAGYGIVAVDYSIYSYLAGMKVYIPGYGLATIGDTGGGPIIESAFGVPRTQWIDLGFNDGEIVDMTGWVTVYFLEPAPAEIPYFLK